MLRAKPSSDAPAALSDRRAVAAAMRDVEAGSPPSRAAAALGVTEAEFEALRKQAIERRTARLAGVLPLSFHEPDPEAEKTVREDVSAIVATGDGEALWIGADEGASLERLTAERDLNGKIVGYGSHKRFDLHDFFDFPSGADEEADIEGLSLADGYLWVVGSHSLKRKKPHATDDDPDSALEKLTTVVREPNRFLLGRIPLVAGDRPGVPSLASTGPALGGGGKRRAGSIKMTSAGSALSKRLATDRHLGPFLSVPSKDNGLDVEGMAVRDDRVFLGLRGPVLRGWAVVLEVAFEETAKGRLKLKPVAEGQEYRKHFLDLDGLGIRSLMVDGSDLIILAGPTMDLDGPVRLYRWRGALGAQTSTVTPRADVERLLDLPFGEGVDHAEGATVLRLAPGEPPALLVAYDSPAEARLLPGGGVNADLFDLRDVF
jgi:hypothetical protein